MIVCRLEWDPVQSLNHKNSLFKTRVVAQSDEYNASCFEYVHLMHPTKRARCTIKCIFVVVVAILKRTFRKIYSQSGRWVLYKMSAGALWEQKRRESVLPTRHRWRDPGKRGTWRMSVRCSPARLRLRGRCGPAVRRPWPQAPWTGSCCYHEDERFPAQTEF